MHPSALALLRGDQVSEVLWCSLWHQLDRATLDRLDATVVLSSLSTTLPDLATMTALLRSLRPEPVRPSPPGGVPTVNIVGTGGGPATFNVSTAAAIVAATMGVRVLKTGSTAYTSKLGSIDMLRRLGIRVSGSAEESELALERFGIAFAGGYVYPHQFTQLARLIYPSALTSFGRFMNMVGPLVAAADVDLQVTGLSASAPRGLLQHAAAGAVGRRIWWCTNDLGADELISFAQNNIQSGLTTVTIPAGLTCAGGSLEDLRPIEDPAEAVEDFLAVLAAERNAVATETVALNAAAVAVAAGADGWKGAYETACEVLRSGAAVALVDRLRHEGAPRNGFAAPAASRG